MYIKIYKNNRTISGFIKRPKNWNKKSIVFIPGLTCFWNEDVVAAREPRRFLEKKFFEGYEVSIFSDEVYSHVNSDWEIDIFSTYVENTIEWLKYLNGKNETQEINLIGHSLGALVLSIISNKVNIDNIGKIILMGYPPSDLIKKLSFDSYISRYKSNFNSDYKLYFEKMNKDSLEKYVKFDKIDDFKITSIIQGENDEIFDFNDVKEKLKNSNVGIIKIPNSGHVFAPVGDKFDLNKEGIIDIQEKNWKMCFNIVEEILNE